MNMIEEIQKTVEAMTSVEQPRPWGAYKIGGPAKERRFRARVNKRILFEYKKIETREAKQKLLETKGEGIKDGPITDSR